MVNELHHEPLYLNPRMPGPPLGTSDAECNPRARCRSRGPGGLKASGYRLLHVDRNRVAEPLDRAMEVVADLERQAMLPRRQLHIDDVLAVAEVHPRRGAGDRRSDGQA